MNIGEKVEIITNDDKQHIGVVMPSVNENVIVIKMDNGYNIGIDKSKVKKSNVLESVKTEDKKTLNSNVNNDSNKESILILHTGGTIASKVDYRTGGVVSRFEPEDLLAMFPKLSEVGNIKSDFIRNMWSDDLRFSHLKVIAEKIKEYVDNPNQKIKGVIIGIGTDNLAVAAAGLSFIVEETPFPIIFVGAQRSSDRASSDAAMNLICASEFINKTNYKGVAICMHSGSSDSVCNILPPNKTKKLHTSRRDAFKAVNDTLIATIDYKTKTVLNVKTGDDFNSVGEKLVIKTNMEEKVGIVKAVINMMPQQISAFTGYKGLIIEGTGLGHVPIDVIDDETKIHSKIFSEIKKLVESGCIVVMTSNCIYGRVNMNVYSKGRDLQQMGVISGEDMLSEVAYMKLAWLLGNYSVDEAKRMIGTNIRGEIKNSRIYDEDF